MTFDKRVQDYLDRVEVTLEHYLPGPQLPPRRLHEAMRYATLGAGKRIRPLLVYATGEALGIEPHLLDAPAAAIEMMHAFSLVHDDLPAMDNDHLRRGKPTTHKAFGEATAILAADALQPLAFGVIASAPALVPYPETQIRLVALLAEACGSNGMTGGQAIDIEAEGGSLNPAELEHMYRLKTGRLLRASVLAPTCCPPISSTEIVHSLERYVDYLGLAFQIRDDILDIEGKTADIGKPQGADFAKNKATYPAMFGIEAARHRADELLDQAITELADFGKLADGLLWLAHLIVERKA